MIAEPRPVVLVTGSSGLIGTAVINQLKDRYEVVGLDIVEPKQRPEGTAFIRCDLSSDEGVQKAMEQVRRDHGPRIGSVVHLAAYYDFTGAPSDKYEQITIRGTQRLLRRLKQFEHVGQFIFSSTMLVHAPCRPPQRISEEWPLNPKWAYPKSKVRTEEVILTEHGDIPSVILRIAGVYDDYGHSLPVSNQIQRIAEKWLTAYVYPGNVAHGQALVHLEDLAAAIRQAVDRRQQLDREMVLLIGEPETVGYGELQRRLVELLHGREELRRWRTQRVPKMLAKLGAWIQEKVPGIPPDPFIKPWMINMADDHYELDIGRARRYLGWEPQHRLRDALPKMVEALKADPEGWFREHKLELSDELRRRLERERPREPEKAPAEQAQPGGRVGEQTRQQQR